MSEASPGHAPETTPEEEDVMRRYTSILAVAFIMAPTKEEKQKFAQDVLDTIKVLETAPSLDPSFQGEMLQRLRTVKEQYVALGEFSYFAKGLERESRGGVQVPHLYRKAVSAFEKARDLGVPEQALYHFQDILTDYLRMVRQQR